MRHCRFVASLLAPTIVFRSSLLAPSHLASYKPRLVADLLHEVLVVRDANHGALEGADAIREGADALEV